MSVIVNVPGLNMPVFDNNGAWVAAAVRAEPDGTEGFGEAILVSALGLGHFSGHSNAVAIFSGGGEWLFLSPKEGQQCYVKDTNVTYEFDGTSWNAIPTIPSIQTDIDVLRADVTDTQTSVQENTAAIVSLDASYAGSGKIYPDTATGIANTSGTGAANRYFAVPGVYSNGFLTLYRNDAGEAVETATGIGDTYVSVAGEEAGHPLEWVMGGKLAVYVDLDGYFTPWRFRAPLQSIDRASLTDEVTSKLLGASVGGSFAEVTEEQGCLYPFYVGDQLVLGLPFGSNVWLGKIERSGVADRSLVSGAGLLTDDALIDQVLDEDGKYQLRSIAKAGGKYVQLTDEGNNTAPTLTDNGRLLFVSDESGAPVTRVMEVAGGPSYPAVSIPNILAAGDSLTYGAGGEPYTTALSANTGLPVINDGWPSQTSEQILCRYIGTTLTVSGDEIPTSGPVDVTAIAVTILYINGDPERSIPGTVAGVHGTLAVDTSGDYTFTRTADGSAVSCPPNSSFIPDARDYDTMTLVAWPGRNDGWTSGTPGTTLLARVVTLFDWFKPIAKKYLLLGVVTASTDDSGTKGRITAYNTSAAALYGDNFIDVLGYLTDETWLTARGVSLDSDDLTDITAGVPPRSIRSDVLHGTSTYYALIEYLVQERMQSMGWI